MPIRNQPRPVVAADVGRPPRTPFEAALAERFRPPAAGSLDAVLALAVDDGPVLATLTVVGGQLRFAPPSPTDATFFFDSEATARALLCEGADPMAAFMAGRFRADSHLPLAFTLLGLFRPDYAPVPPP